MVQQPRQPQPLYSCAIALDAVTGRSDEEIVAFGTSVEDAKRQAEQLLASDDRCQNADVGALLATARIEALSPWCSPDGE